jgi:glutamine synthetase
MPAVFSYRKELADTITSLKNLGFEIKDAPEQQVLEVLDEQAKKLSKLTNALIQIIQVYETIEEAEKEAVFANEKLLPVLDQVRGVCDVIENYIPDKKWPFPKYTKLFF